jgi:hypothetical protein
VFGSLFESVGKFESDGVELSGIGLTSIFQYRYSAKMHICPECANPLREILTQWWSRQSRTPSDAEIDDGMGDVTEDFSG